MKRHSATFRALAAGACLAASLSVHAHGDEPHGDAPHPAAGVQAAQPRFESATELFEMVGRLEAGALLLYINRFETSEPVAQATVELESGERKARALYEPASGAYRVSEPAWVQALARPGRHPLVVSVIAGPDADLMEGTLDVPAAAESGPRGAGLLRPVAGSVALAALAAVAAALVFRRRRHHGKGRQGVRA